jgi:hypothetical protein
MWIDVTLTGVVTTDTTIVTVRPNYLVLNSRDTADFGDAGILIG